MDDGDFIVVERDKGGGFLVAGEGTKACAALAGAAGGDFGKEIRAAEEIVAAVRRGDARPIAAILMDGIPETWPETLVDIIWPRHVARWGEIEGVRTLGATALGPGRVRILMELRHKGGKPRLEVVLQDGRLNIFDLNGPRFAVATVYRPVGLGVRGLRVARATAARDPLRCRVARPRRSGRRSARAPGRSREAALTTSRPPCLRGSRGGRTRGGPPPERKEGYPPGEGRPHLPRSKNLFPAGLT